METGQPKPFHRILSTEMIAMYNQPVRGISLSEHQSDNFSEWFVDVLGAAGTLYEGEKFQLRFKFPDEYPFRPPKVQFMPPNIPLNPHVFSNGDICLSILTKDWAPSLHVQGVCLSIQSMLSSCKNKVLPPDNEYYLYMAQNAPQEYKWVYYTIRPSAYFCWLPCCYQTSELSMQVGATHLNRGIQVMVPDDRV